MDLPDIKNETIRIITLEHELRIKEKYELILIEISDVSYFEGWVGTIDPEMNNPSKASERKIYATTMKRTYDDLHSEFKGESFNAPSSSFYPEVTTPNAIIYIRLWIKKVLGLILFHAGQVEFLSFLAKLQAKLDEITRAQFTKAFETVGVNISVFNGMYTMSECPANESFIQMVNRLDHLNDEESRLLWSYTRYYFLLPLDEISKAANPPFTNILMGHAKDIKREIYLIHEFAKRKSIK